MGGRQTIQFPLSPAGKLFHRNPLPVRQQLVDEVSNQATVHGFHLCAWVMPAPETFHSKRSHSPGLMGWQVRFDAASQVMRCGGQPVLGDGKDGNIRTQKKFARWWRQAVATPVGVV